MRHILHKRVPYILGQRVDELFKFLEYKENLLGAEKIRLEKEALEVLRYFSLFINSLDQIHRLIISMTLFNKKLKLNFKFGSERIASINIC